MRSGNMLVDRHEEENTISGRGYCFDCEYNPCKCDELKAVKDEELDAYRQSFEDFLVEKHAEQYNGIDDDMPDDFDWWFECLEIEEVAQLAEEYGKKCFKDGRLRK